MKLALSPSQETEQKIAFIVTLEIGHQHVHNRRTGHCNDNRVLTLRYGAAKLLIDSIEVPD